MCCAHEVVCWRDCASQCYQCPCCVLLDWLVCECRHPMTVCIELPQPAYVRAVNQLCFKTDESPFVPYTCLPLYRYSVVYSHTCLPLSVMEGTLVGGGDDCGALDGPLMRTWRRLLCRLVACKWA